MRRIGITFQMKEEQVHVKKGKLSQLQSIVEQGRKVADILRKDELKERLIDELTSDEKITCLDKLNMRPEIYQLLKDNPGLGKLVSLGHSGKTFELLVEK